MLTRAGWTSLVASALLLFWGAGSVMAQHLSAQDRNEILRLRATGGFATQDVNRLIEQVDKAGEKGIPIEPLANKVKEGLAKGVEPKRIEPVLRQMANNLETANDVLKEAGAHDVVGGNHQRAVEMMAEAFSRGATAEEVRELVKVVQEGNVKITQEALAAGAKGLAVMKEAQIPSTDGTALVGEGLRQQYRPAELLDLSREVKQHGSEFRDDHANVESLRERISHGERGEQLFHDERRDSAGGGRGNRGRQEGSTRDRGDHPERKDDSDHPDHSDRPEHFERPDSGHDR